MASKDTAFTNQEFVDYAYRKGILDPNRRYRVKDINSNVKDVIDAFQINDEDHYYANNDDEALVHEKIGIVYEYVAYVKASRWIQGAPGTTSIKYMLFKAFISKGLNIALADKLLSRISQTLWSVVTTKTPPQRLRACIDMLMNKDNAFYTWIDRLVDECKLKGCTKDYSTLVPEATLTKLLKGIVS